MRTGGRTFLPLIFRPIDFMTPGRKYAIVFGFPMNRIATLCTALSISFSFTSFASERWGAMAVVKQYCYDCHDRDGQKGDLDLESLQGKAIANDSIVWEKVVRKMNARQM